VTTLVCRKIAIEKPRPVEKPRFPKRAIRVVVDGNRDDRGGTVSVVDGPAKAALAKRTYE
jgi:hypothetical protein